VTRAAVKWEDRATTILSPPPPHAVLLMIRCPKHPRAAMPEVWRWAAGLQAVAEPLHRRSALAWCAPLLVMLVTYFSACNMEEHEGINPAGGGSRHAIPVKV
jgi:hypothetical protein